MRQEMRLCGSRATMLARRSRPYSSKFCVCCDIGIPFHLGKVALKSGNFRAAGQLLSLGVPYT